MQEHTLGKSSTLLTPVTIEEHRAIALALAQQATRELLIFTQTLDHALFDNAEFEDAASHLARRSQYAAVHILVQDSSAAVRRGHRLVELAQRLGSRVKIRRPNDDYLDARQSFLVADETGYLSRQFADDYANGVAHFSDRSSARNLANFFNEVWERSEADPQLRRLHL